MARASTAIVVWDRPELRELARVPAPVGGDLSTNVPSGSAMGTSGASRATIESSGIEVFPYDVPEPVLGDNGCPTVLDEAHDRLQHHRCALGIQL